MTHSLRTLTAFSFLMFIWYLNYIHVSLTEQHVFPIKERKQFRFIDKKEFKMKKGAIYRQQVFMTNYRPIKNSAGMNCTKIIINRDQEEIRLSKQLVRKPFNLTADFYLDITSDCDTFRHSRGYIDHPLSKAEHDFPIAFSVLVYTDIEQAERLLRLLYRPHNFYCIHMDNKMNDTEKEAFKKIANCLNNVLIVEEPVNVTWGNFSLLEAELLCMKTLWPYKQWKYYINLTGQEFPLKTNRQIVAILKVLDGANVVDGSLSRTLAHYTNRWSMANEPAPYNIQVVKGSMHVAANRYLVDFCLHDPVSLEFIEWLKKTRVPDESFFSSLNHNPHLGIPGSFLGEPEEYCLKPFFLRYVIWQFQGYRELVKTCFGKFVRTVCVFGVEDLHSAYSSVRLFANKFHLDFEHIALDCLEEFLYERTWQEYIEDIPVDTSYYSNLDYAKMQLKP